MSLAEVLDGLIQLLPREDALLLQHLHQLGDRPHRGDGEVVAGDEAVGCEGMAQRVHVEHKNELDSTSCDTYKARQRKALWGD
jgi:hypothetical protein